MHEAGVAIDRPRLFFWLLLMAASNKLVGMMIVNVDNAGLTNSALNLFGISAILWLALAAGLALLREAGPEPVRRGDVAIAIVVVAAAIAPFYSLSGAALTLAALYATVTSEVGSSLKRAAIIFLAMTGSLMWGPLLLDVFSRPLLGLDAFFVAQLVGSAQTGNQLSFADGSGNFIIAPGCSSFHGMSLALVFWATVNQWFGVTFNWAAVRWLLAALTVTILINVIRIGAIAHYPVHFDFLHSGWGAMAASWTTLLLVVALCLYGARREIFSPA